MLSLTHIIVLVKRGVIQAGKVAGDQIHDPIEMSYTTDLLPKAFATIKDYYHTHTVRIVMDDEVSYTLEVTIPVETKDEDERQAVADQISLEVPEVITQGNWDYKLKEIKENQKVLTVFVPVQDIFHNISSAAAQAGLTIEAIESASISTTRHAEPMVGMALKTDLKGKDEVVLNVKPLSSTPNTPVATKKRFSPTLIFLIITPLILAILIYSYLSKSPTKTTSTPSPSPTSSSLITSTPTPSPETPALSTLKLQVLNGSGVAGRAGEVGDLLVAEGFATPTVGNADNYDYTETVVRLSPNIPASVYDTISRSLNSDYALKLADPLTSNSEYDVVVIVGDKI